MKMITTSLCTSSRNITAQNWITISGNISQEEFGKKNEKEIYKAAIGQSGKMSQSKEGHP
jgi:uncharacterized membrane protein YcgQ (UPF0703/DUF1980 family)